MYEVSTGQCFATPIAIGPYSVRTSISPASAIQLAGSATEARAGPRQDLADRDGPPFDFKTPARWRALLSWAKV
ncbi:hypothetical protein SCP_0202320 [Sparassis crispa]|uniref:Uncharacterized protein n=1 Tax=Sparassis crispa TaxID=139825 RepID=A0A401GA42_9APHY|nr:hypothetical protein SCP_0202320 [Sparassis crispa]GBE79035.1 hypothetical protein SCP_0202320 [Sparassis crispa]